MPSDMALLEDWMPFLVYYIHIHPAYHLLAIFVETIVSLQITVQTLLRKPAWS